MILQNSTKGKFFFFNNGLPIYTFEYICQEDGKTTLDDGALKHFFIANTCAKMIEDEEPMTLMLVKKKALPLVNNAEDKKLPLKAQKTF